MLFSTRCSAHFTQALKRLANQSLLLLSLMNLSAAGPAIAQETGAARVAPEHVLKHVDAPQITGPGRLTWLGFHVYDAYLYSSKSFNAAQPLVSPFVLELTYARRLEGKAIAETSRDEIERLGLGTEEQRNRWFERMLQLFPNVESGSRIAGVNLPSKGAYFYVDGKPVGGIEEPEFARAFFSIWLDERSRAPKVRSALLAPPPS